MPSKFHRWSRVVRNNRVSGSRSCMLESCGVTVAMKVQEVGHQRALKAPAQVKSWREAKQDPRGRPWGVSTKVVYLGIHHPRESTTNSRCSCWPARTAPKGDQRGQRRLREGWFLISQALLPCASGLLHFPLNNSNRELDVEKDTRQCDSPLDGTIHQRGC